MDALAIGDDEGRGRLRKAAGRCQQPLIRGCPNGETHWVLCPVSRKGGELRELKYLST